MTIKMMKDDRCYNINNSAEDIARAKAMGMVLVDEPKAEAKQDEHIEPVAEKRTRRAKKDAQ